MGQQALKTVPARRVKMFRIKNRRGYAAVCLGNLTEGKTPAEAFARLTHPLRRMGYRLPARVPSLVSTAALLLALALPGAASAEVLHLKDGRRVEAPIITQDDRAVVVDWYGVRVTYWQDQIDHITPGATADAAPAPADRVAGALKDDELARLAGLVEQGKRFCEAKQYDEAEQVARQAVDLAEREFGPSDPRVVQPLLLLSYVYLSQNRVEEGIASRDRADAIEQALGSAS